MLRKLKLVNGFKAPEDWYELVLRISQERHTTVGGAIQYVFNLGLPIYEHVRAIELAAIAAALPLRAEGQSQDAPLIKSAVGENVSVTKVLAQLPGKGIPSRPR